MPRSGHEARERLEVAALELYRQRGFDRTTTAQIAERAGVTERTFFHHFPDKREVLFGREERLRGLLVAAVHDAPGESAPLDVLLGAFRSIDGFMEEGWSYAQLRNGVIAAAPALREREAAKLSMLADALASALVERGTPTRRATLAAHAAVAAFTVAALAWYRDPSLSLGVQLVQAFDDLRGACAP
ncbi:helix-turn-helix domain-containing protein [Pseudonocardia tropica]|uniref:Helix-turn-helix domain-containing protein n=1 Tax=Pseudonocardia tropica TaxID=681289 RepID=A0ABV1K0D0_9PSEU